MKEIVRYEFDWSGGGLWGILRDRMGKIGWVRWLCEGFIGYFFNMFFCSFCV